jgi:integrase
MARFFKDPHTLQYKRQGPLGPYIDEFLRQLSEQSYSRQYACRPLQLVAELSHWLQQRDLAVTDLTVAKVENFLRNRARPARIRRGDAAGLKAFFELLRRKGQIATTLTTWASDETGAPQSILRHADVSTTPAYYILPKHERAQAGMKKLENTLKAKYNIKA